MKRKVGVVWRAGSFRGREREGVRGRARENDQRGLGREKRTQGGWCASSRFTTTVYS